MSDNNIKPLFDLEPRYNPDSCEIDQILRKIKKVINDNLGERVTEFHRLSIGQNINFKVYTEGSKSPQFLLRIVSMKGYPSIASLENCYRLIEKTDIRYSKICYSDNSSDIVPYGFFVQNWIEGTDALERYGEHNTEICFDWVDDFMHLLKKAHKISIPYYGYIDGGPKFNTLKDYYDNMDVVIDNSFGDVFREKYSIWDLEKLELVSEGFLKTTFERVKELSSTIKSPTESVLIHGDMFPQNLIYTDSGCALIDWDECRANWWVYEIARTSYYMESRELIQYFIRNYGDSSATQEDIDSGIRLEHTRQLLRQMFITAFFNGNRDEIRNNTRKFEDLINRKLVNRFF